MLSLPAFLPPDLVIERFISRTGTSLVLLAGRDQTRDISRCRQELMWLLRQLTTASTRQIGAMLGERTSATVDEAVDRISMRAASDPDYRRALSDLHVAVAQPQPEHRSDRLDLLRAMAAGLLCDHRLSDADACEGVLNLLRGSAPQSHERNRP